MRTELPNAFKLEVFVSWVRSLGWEDPLEKGKATYSSILAWRISWTTGHVVTKSQTQLNKFVETVDGIKMF